MISSEWLLPRVRKNRAALTRLFGGRTHTACSVTARALGPAQAPVHYRQQPLVIFARLAPILKKVVKKACIAIYRAL